MYRDKEKSLWFCDICGFITDNDIILEFDEYLDNYISSVLIKCRYCKNVVEYVEPKSNVHRYYKRESKAIVLNGICGSGKTSIAYLISKIHKYIQVDGDWLLHCYRNIKHYKVNVESINPYLLNLSLGLVHLGHNVVISHLIMPCKIKHVCEIFSKRKISCNLVILMPDYEELIRRNTIRECWKNKTDVYWIDMLYKEFKDCKEIYRYYHDNTYESKSETVNKIMEKN